MDNKKKTENIWGMTPPVGPCAPQKFSTPGDMQNKFCGYLENSCGMKKKDAGILVQTESFLGSVISRSSRVVIPPKYHAEVVKGFRDRLTLEGVAPDKVDKQTAVYSAQLKARWAEKGGALLDKSGGETLLDGEGSFLSSKAGKAKAKKKNKKKKAKPKARGATSRAQGKGAEEIDAEDDAIDDGDGDEFDEESDKASVSSSSSSDLEDLAQTGTQQVLGSVGMGAFLSNKHNNHAVQAALRMEADAFAAFAAFASSSPPGVLALKKLREMTPADMVDSSLLTQMERDLGVVPNFRIALSILQAELLHGKSKDTLAAVALQAFTSHVHTAEDPLSALVAFKSALQCYITDASGTGGASLDIYSADNGPLAEVYIRAYELSPHKHMQGIGKGVRDAYASKEISDALSAGGSAASERTLDQAHELAMIQWKRHSGSTVVPKGESNVGSSLQVKTHKQKKMSEDGPNQSANAAQAVTANLAGCFICGQQHKMRDVDAVGNRFHSESELARHHDARRQQQIDEAAKRAAKAASDAAKSQGKGDKGFGKGGRKGGKIGKGGSGGKWQGSAGKGGSGSGGHSSGGAHWIDALAQAKLDAVEAEALSFKAKKKAEILAESYERRAQVDSSSENS